MYNPRVDKVLGCAFDNFEKIPSQPVGSPSLFISLAQSAAALRVAVSLPYMYEYAMLVLNLTQRFGEDEQLVALISFTPLLVAVRGATVIRACLRKYCVTSCFINVSCPS